MCVHVREQCAPPGVKALGWFLLTTIAIDTGEQAEQMIRWYRLRWRTDPGATKRAPKTLGEAVRLTAIVGGYLARNNDGPPGDELMWWGYARLAGICLGFALGKNVPPPACGANPADRLMGKGQPWEVVRE